MKKPKGNKLGTQGAGRDAKLRLCGRFVVPFCGSEIICQKIKAPRIFKMLFLFSLIRGNHRKYLRRIQDTIAVGVVDTGIWDLEDLSRDPVEAWRIYSRIRKGA